MLEILSVLSNETMGCMGDVEPGLLSVLTFDSLPPAESEYVRSCHVRSCVAPRPPVLSGQIALEP
jgi:hypothetical protein